MGILSSIKNKTTGTINPIPRTSKEVLINIRINIMMLFAFRKLGKLIQTLLRYFIKNYYLDIAPHFAKKHFEQIFFHFCYAGK